ncbi:MAG: hypothetical protein DI571_03800 [Arsenicicoccus sp.]|nr:MAG: hypothetical protein DI571_03800 [Arsenicicoccus sp.]
MPHPRGREKIPLGYAGGSVCARTAARAGAPARLRSTLVSAAAKSPGPGLLLTFAGLWILSTQYAWARRWTNPVKIRALRGAAEGVETIPRIILSALIALGLVGVRRAGGRSTSAGGSSAVGRSPSP